MSVKCSPCTDAAIAEGVTADDVPTADIIITVMQTFTMGGQQMAAPVTMGVCFNCRKDQLGIVSKTGLVTA